MTDAPISPLRQRMIEDMTARHFAEKAQTDYIRYVKNFAAFLGRSPDTASAEDLRLFQQHMTKTHVSPGHQCDGRRAAVLFQGDARTRRSGQASDVGERAAQGSDRFEPGGGGSLLTAAPGVKYKAAPWPTEPVCACPRSSR